MTLSYRLGSLLTGLFIGVAVLFTSPAQANVTITEQFSMEVVCGDSVFEDEHKNLHIDTVNNEPSGFENIAPWYGPDGKEYIKILEPDTMKNGPWSAQVFVPRFSKPSLLIKVDNLHDESAVYWISQTEIVVEASWGRFAETLFHIDVEKGDVSVARDIDYGPATVPFEEACPDSPKKLPKTRKNQ